MQLQNLWHLPFAGKLCHPCLIWIAELPKACFKRSCMGGRFHLCVRLLFKKKEENNHAFAKQSLWGYFNYYYCSSKAVSEVLEMFLNLNCQENSSEFGKWGKRDKYCQMPDLFSDFTINSCYSLTSLFCVRFKSVLNMRFHAKSVTALRGKIAFPC